MLRLALNRVAAMMHPPPFTPMLLPTPAPNWLITVPGSSTRLNVGVQARVPALVVASDEPEHAMQTPATDMTESQTEAGSGFARRDCRVMALDSPGLDTLSIQTLTGTDHIMI